MRRIPYRGLKVIRGWALPLVRRIICADYGDRDENAPEPEPENVPEADPTEALARDIRAVWKTPKFVLAVEALERDKKAGVLGPERLNPYGLIGRKRMWPKQERTALEG